MADERYVSALTGAQMDDAFTEMNNRAPEGWTRGTKDGVPVPSTSPYYENNAKYYAELASENGEVEVLKAEGYAVGTQDGEEVPSTSPYYENNAKYYAEEAERQKDDAVNAAIAAIAPKKTVSNDPDNAVFDAVLNDAINAPLLSTLIKGKTVAWNQVVDPIASQTVNGVSVTSSDGKYTFSGTATTSGGRNVALSRKNVDVVNGHTYLFFSTFASDVFAGVFLSDIATSSIVLGLGTSTLIRTATVSASCRFGVNVLAREYNESGYMYIVDLNNSPVASRLTEIGTDVAKLKQVWLEETGKPLPSFIPYDAGSLKNVDGEYRLTGKNLVEGYLAGQAISANGTITAASNFNMAYGRIKKGQEYIVTTDESNLITGFYTEQPAAGSVSYDGSRINTESKVFTAPIDGWIAFRGTSSFTAFQLELGSTATAYEPYYNGGVIDCSSAPLNGVGDAQDEKDFATGTRVTRCGIVDLGTLTWNYNTAYAYPFFYANIPNDNINYESTEIILCCARYQPIGGKTAANFRTNDYAKCIANITNQSAGSRIAVQDSAYTDAATFKAAMSGVMLAYELATPVSSTETPQPLTTQDGYNVLRPVSGDVQSAELTATYSETVEGYVNEKIAELQAIVLENINA